MIRATFITRRIRAVWRALCSLLQQTLLWLDQGLNVALGIKGAFLAAWTGEEQATCYADETLSAHAWRAEQAGKPWSELTRPLVDRMFFWQGTEPAVDAAVGEPVRGHCRRAFWKKKLRLGLPSEYRS